MEVDNDLSQPLTAIMHPQFTFSNTNLIKRSCPKSRKYTILFQCTAGLVPINCRSFLKSYFRCLQVWWSNQGEGVIFSGQILFVMHLFQCSINNYPTPLCSQNEEFPAQAQTGTLCSHILKVSIHESVQIKVQLQYKV